MGGHDILRASMVAREIGLERERKMMLHHHRMMAREQATGQISELSWFGGIKATARFLSDAVRAGFAQRRMTEARG
ncbi:MAG: hypothetical protein R2848_04960 [Thermomicrobiales bacterium]